MLPLYLLAAHMSGDFLLQNRFMASAKTDDNGALAGHVLFYCVPFVPIASVYGDHWHLFNGPFVFLLALAAVHFLTDAHRFRSTPGDVLAWWLMPSGGPGWRESIWQIRVDDPESDVAAMPDTLRWPPPNEWGPMSLLIDQTLHVLQVAVLAGLLLR